MNFLSKVSTWLQKSVEKKLVSSKGYQDIKNIYMIYIFPRVVISWYLDQI